MSKKIYLLSSLLLIIGFIAQGQEERMPFGDESSYSISQISPRPLIYNYLKESSEVLFYEDFEDYPQGLNPDRWDVMRSTVGNGSDLTSATAPMWFLCNAGSFYGNGYNYINSGSYSAAISYLASNFTWLISKDTIDIASAELKLNFWLYYYSTAAQPTFFHVKAQNVDTGEWYNLQRWNQNSPSNIFQQRISIPLDILFDDGVEKFIFAFVYENQNNSGFQLAVDDIVVTDFDEPVLNITPFFFPFSMVPAQLVGSYNFSINAFVHNLGQTYRDTSSTLVVLIPELNEFETFKVLTDSILPGEIKLYSMAEKPVFASQNTYNVNYSIIPTVDDDEEDEGGEERNNLLSVNNLKGSDSFQFSVTQNTFATDYCSSLGVYGGVSAGKNIIFGNFYNIPAPTVASGIEITWPTFSGNDIFNAFIYELNPIDSSATLIYQSVFEKQSEHSNLSVTYTIDNTYLAPGTIYFIAVEQVNNTPLGIGFDRVKNGHFWRLNNQQQFEKLTNPSVGNVAIRLRVTTPVNNPLLSFTVIGEDGPLEGASILVHNQGTTATNSEGFASMQLSNGTYAYTVSKEGFASIVDTARIQYVNVHKNITLEKAFSVTFAVKDIDENILENVEVFISSQTLVTDSEGEAQVFLASGFYDYIITFSGFTPHYDNIEVVKDTIVSITLTAAEATHAINFHIVNQHLGLPMEDVRITLPNYGIKFTNSSGEATFTGVLPTEEEITYNLYKQGYYFKSSTIPSVDSDIQVPDTLQIIKYSLIVHVVDTFEAPIFGAQVTLSGHTMQLTSLQGYTTINNIVPGQNIGLTAWKQGYQGHSSAVTIIDSDIIANITLPPVPVSTPTINLGEFSVFPNPSSGLINIVGDGTFNVYVFDLTGRLLQSHPSTNGKLVIDLTINQPGIYLLKVVSENYSKTIKVIKQ